MYRLIFAFLIMILATPSYSTSDDSFHAYDKYPHAATLYYGVTGTDPLIRILEGTFHRWPEHIQALELSKTLDSKNPIRVFFQPLVSNMQFAINFAQRNDINHHLIYEVDPYVVFRWENFPWKNYINTSFAIGEGVSYATSVPSLEKKDNKGTKRLLNYLMLEATFASPNHPQWQLVTRIHHRSGAYGLYHAGNSGSNVVGLGVRYLFE